MAGKEKPRKYDPLHPKELEDRKPHFRPDRVEGGLEADDTRPLFASDSIHPTRELKFSLDSDGPVGGYVPHADTAIEDADEEVRELRGREEVDKDREEPED